MDLEFLKRGARQFAYQLRKFFPEDETPINHYVCKEHVIVISTKKLYVYYVDKYIDYVGELLVKVDLNEINQELLSFKVGIDGKVFVIEFEREKDYTSFMKYYNKYKD